jgi:hypothetical protein
MAMPADTGTLSDAEILHLLRTRAPGVPPGLDHPPLPPDTLTSPPWAAHPPTAHLGRWIALAGGLGMLILWGLVHGRSDGAAPVRLAAYPTLAPGEVYVASAPATATVPASPTMPLLAPSPAPPTNPPTLPLALPPTVATIPPPTLPPPSVTPVPVVAPPMQRPRPRPTTPPRPPTPAPPSVPTPPTAPPPPAGGSGGWGNDWSGSIFDRSSTIGAPTPAPSSRP